MDKRRESRNAGPFFVDKYVESVDETAVYEPNMHSLPFVYAFMERMYGEYFTNHFTFCLFGNISSVILKMREYRRFVP